MGIRQTINENPAMTAVATGGIILLALIFIIYQAFGGHGSSSGRLGKVFFSDDDGKTWFADDASKLPPIDHDGKPAYRALIYKCADGVEFCAFLERYSPEAKAQMEEQAKNNPKMAPMLQMTASLNGIQVKKPGLGDWITMSPSTSAEARSAMDPVCPDGTSNGLVPVSP